MTKNNFIKKISWNHNVKLILSDVDETIADLYQPTSLEMIKELTQLLKQGIVLFFITGQSLQSVQWRIVNQIPITLRNRILVGACNGAEVWGFDVQGNKHNSPHYSLYDQMLTKDQKKIWRKIIQQLITEFKLQLYQTSPILQFQEKAGNNILSIMMEDRGAQITFEVVNGYNITENQVKSLKIEIPKIHDIYDLRRTIMQRADELFKKANLPVTSRLGGVFALDFVLNGINKTTAVRHALETPNILLSISLSPNDISNPQNIEIWGDKFSIIGGSDRYMSEAVDKRVRSIDFRQENPDEFPTGYNIVVWNGSFRLQDGTLEYLKSRH